MAVPLANSGWEIQVRAKLLSCPCPFSSGHMLPHRHLKLGQAPSPTKLLKTTLLSLTSCLGTTWPPLTLGLTSC